MAGCTDTCVSFGLPPEEGAYSSRWGCPADQKLIAMPKLTASVKTFRVLVVSATVGVIISIICSVITLDCSEVLPDDKAHLIVLPVASTTCKSGSGRWQAAALLGRANHDNHSPLGRRRFTNLWPRCNQRGDYQLAVGSFLDLMRMRQNLVTLIRVVCIQPDFHVRSCIFFGIKLRC